MLATALRRQGLSLSVPIHPEEWGVVGRKVGWIASEDGGNGGMAFENPVQKLPDFGPVPAGRMTKGPVKREVSLIKVAGLQFLRVRAEGRQIENGHVQKNDIFLIPDHKIKGLKGVWFLFRRGSEQQVSVCRNSRLMQGFEGVSRHY
jgi:hypothetical protein